MALVWHVGPIPLKGKHVLVSLRQGPNPFH